MSAQSQVKVTEAENAIILQKPTRISLGQFFFFNVCIAKNGPHLKSGQIIIVQVDSIVIRSAKPYLLEYGTRARLVMANE